MKPVRFVGLLLVLAGCLGKGHGGAKQIGLVEPAIEFTDLNVGPEIPINRGLQFALKAELKIRNPNSIPIHAQTVRLALGGTVRLEMTQNSRVIDADIPAGASRVIPVEFLAFTRAPEVHLFPLSVTGRVFFDSARGPFSVALVKTYNPDGQPADPDEDPESEE
jgi:hypothetical protein